MTKLNLMLNLLQQVLDNKAPSPLVEALEFRRDQYGLTKAEFSTLLGIAPSHYGEVVSGKRRLSVKAMKRAYAVGVPHTVLLGEE